MHKEITRAIEIEKKLIVIYLEPTDKLKHGLNLGLTDIQYIELSQSNCDVFKNRFKKKVLEALPQSLIDIDKEIKNDRKDQAIEEMLASLSPYLLGLEVPKGEEKNDEDTDSKAQKETYKKTETPQAEPGAVTTSVFWVRYVYDKALRLPKWTKILSLGLLGAIGTIFLLYILYIVNPGRVTVHPHPPPKSPLNAPTDTLVTPSAIKPTLPIVSSPGVEVIQGADKPYDTTGSSNIKPQSKRCQNLRECLTSAKASLDSGELIDAREYATQAIQFDPKNQAAYILLGAALVKLSKWSNARIEFEKAIQINPNTPEANAAQQWLTGFKNPINVTFLPFEEGDVEANINPMLKDIDRDMVKRAEMDLKNQSMDAANILADSMHNSGLFQVRRESRNRRDIARIIEDYKKAHFPKGINKAAESEYTKLYINCETINVSCVATDQVWRSPKDNYPNVVYMLFNVTISFNIGIYYTKTSKLLNRLNRAFTISNIPLLRVVINNKRDYNFDLRDMSDALKSVYERLFYDINSLLI